METNRLISEEISYQMNRKMDELKRNLDTQITESINSAIHDSILPPIQNSLSGQNSGLGTNVDSRSSRLSRNTEGKKHQSAWENTQKRIQSNLNNHPRSRDISISSLDCRDDHDSGHFEVIKNHPKKNAQSRNKHKNFCQVRGCSPRQSALQISKNSNRSLGQMAAEVASY